MRGRRKAASILASALLGLMAVLAMPGRALADAASDLREAARAISQAEADKDATDAKLDAQVATLTRLIESGILNAGGVVVARSWRGRAQVAMNWARMRAGQGADASLARASLADFDAVLAFGTDIPPWNVFMANTLYFAGGVARNHLEDNKAAYSYWARCAAIGHAGCLNIMAAAKLTGSGGVSVDLQESIDLNARVYDTGTDYRCAGAFSARMIAEITHLKGIRSVTVDEFQWLQRSYRLLDEIGREEQKDNPCDRSKFEIVEYLMWLGRGQERADLLRAAAARKGANDYAILADYLAGAVSPAAFRDALGKLTLKHVSCGMHFAAAWHAELRSDAALSRTHRDALVAFGGDHCQIEIALLKLRNP